MSNNETKAITLHDLQSQVLRWAGKNFPNAQPYEPLLGVQEEAGELAHAWLKNHQGIRGTEAEHREKMADAVGDIIVFLADFCNRNSLTLEDCVFDAWATASKRDWTKNKKDGAV